MANPPGAQRNDDPKLTLEGAFLTTNKDDVESTAQERQRIVEKKFDPFYRNGGKASAMATVVADKEALEAFENDVRLITEDFYEAHTSERQTTTPEVLLLRMCRTWRRLHWAIYQNGLTTKIPAGTKIWIAGQRKDSIQASAREVYRSIPDRAFILVESVAQLFGLVNPCWEEILEHRLKEAEVALILERQAKVIERVRQSSKDQGSLSKNDEALLVVAWRTLRWLKEKYPEGRRVTTGVETVMKTIETLKGFIETKVPGIEDRLHRSVLGVVRDPTWDPEQQEEEGQLYPNLGVVGGPDGVPEQDQEPVGPLYPVPELVFAQPSDLDPPVNVGKQEEDKPPQQPVPPAPELVFAQPSDLDPPVNVDEQEEDDFQEERVPVPILKKPKKPKKPLQQPVPTAPREEEIRIRQTWNSFKEGLQKLDDDITAGRLDFIALRQLRDPGLPNLIQRRFGLEAAFTRVFGEDYVDPTADEITNLIQTIDRNVKEQLAVPADLEAELAQFREETVALDTHRQTLNQLAKTVYHTTRDDVISAIESWKSWQAAKREVPEDLARSTNPAIRRVLEDDRAYYNDTRPIVQDNLLVILNAYGLRPEDRLEERIAEYVADPELVPVVDPVRPEEDDEERGPDAERPPLEERGPDPVPDGPLLEQPDELPEEVQVRLEPETRIEIRGREQVPLVWPLPGPVRREGIIGRQEVLVYRNGRLYERVRVPMTQEHHRVQVDPNARTEALWTVRVRYTRLEEHDRGQTQLVYPEEEKAAKEDDNNAAKEEDDNNAAKEEDDEEDATEEVLDETYETIRVLPDYRTVPTVYCQRTKTWFPVSEQNALERRYNTHTVQWEYDLRRGRVLLDTRQAHHLMTREDYTAAGLVRFLREQQDFLGRDTDLTEWREPEPGEQAVQRFFTQSSQRLDQLERWLTQALAAAGRVNPIDYLNPTLPEAYRPLPLRQRLQRVRHFQNVVQDLKRGYEERVAAQRLHENHLRQTYYTLTGGPQRAVPLNGLLARGLLEYEGSLLQYTSQSTRRDVFLGSHSMDTQYGMLPDPAWLRLRCTVYVIETRRETSEPRDERLRIDGLISNDGGVMQLVVEPVQFMEGSRRVLQSEQQQRNRERIVRSIRETLARLEALRPATPTGTVPMARVLNEYRLQSVLPNPVEAQFYRDQVAYQRALARALPQLGQDIRTLNSYLFDVLL